eukprot:GDKI01030817.1.p1 GENE.GDKI01030817.1~~GDKI01030817.1.p1  ORF type:complete len:232 (-),score=78.13 GDKI01030817.1:605-1264(-)
MWGLFGSAGKDAEKKGDPREQVREWTRKLRGEMRTIDRQIRSIENEEKKVETEIKAAAKRNDASSCKILAKEIVRSRKAKDRMHESKAQLNSVAMHLQHAAATMRVTDSIKSSTEVMQKMNALVKVQEISATVQELSKEMIKMGLIEEMVGDAIDSMDPAGLEDETEVEVNAVMEELAAGVLSQLPSGQGKIPTAQKQQQAAPARTQQESDLDARLNAL